MTDINEELFIHYAQNREMKVPKVLGPYTIDKLIMETHNGIVVSSVDPQTQLKVAIKCIPQRIFQLNPNVVNIMNTVNDQRIIRVLNSFNYPAANPRFFAIVMPRAILDLFDYKSTLGVLTESIVRSIMKQSLEALQILHSNQIWHRDIRLEHILVTKEMPPPISIAISGFQLSSIIQTPTFTGAAVGALSYAAPELLEISDGKLKFKNHATYSNSIDIYSLGVVMYVLLGNCLPFEVDSPEDAQRLLNGELRFETQEDGQGSFDIVSEEAKDLISLMLKADPKDRISIESALNHAFFQMETENPFENLTPEEIEEINQGLAGL